MVEESNQDIFLIQIDASNFAEFEISEFEISRVDCIWQEKSDSSSVRSVQELCQINSILAVLPQ